MFSNWGSSNAYDSPKDSNNEASLTSILPTQSLRTDLALLVALSTDAMRRDLLAPFEAPPDTPSSKASNPIPPAEDNLISFDDDADTDSTAATRAAAAARQRPRFERELSSPQMQGLRRAALTFFDAWQVSVLRRVGEVLSVRSDAVRLARRQHAASAAAIAKEKKAKDYLDWANGDDEVKGQEEHSLYTPIPTRLVELDEPKRILVLHCLLLLLLSLEHYTSHSRILLVRITHSLCLPARTLSNHEISVAQGLLAAASHMDADESTKKTAATDSANRKWKVGLATIAGAAIIGVTGGLAAPILAAGVGTVMGGLGLGATALSGLLGSLAGSSVLIGGLFGAYGGRMTGRVMERYAKEVEDFKFLPLESDNSDSQHKLRVAIAISGLLTQEPDMINPWRVVSNSGIEPFALRWEMDALLRLGTSLDSIVKSAAWKVAKFEIVRHTLLGALYAGLWPLGLLKMASVVDSPFVVAKARADKAGRVLADALMERCQGKRPVTLIGYSLGARVIYFCLLSLAEHNAFGLVESVVLMGAPTPSSAKDWIRIRAVVSGRVVNVYSADDYILGFLYRSSSIQLGVAGLQAVEGVQGMENVDASGVVKGHMRYRHVVGQILKKIELEDVSDGQVAKEIEALRALEMEEERDVARKTKTMGEEKIEMQDARRIIVVESTEKGKGQEQKAPGHRRDQDTVLVRETEMLQLTPNVSNAPKVAVASANVDDDSDSESEDGRIQMANMDPVPEPDDFESEPERVRFGSPGRGFDVVWGKT
jgi:hypothetical protein